MVQAAGSAAGMSMSSHATSTTTTTQRFVRVSGGASPYVWRGLLPTLGLAGVLWFGVAPFAANEIEATVRGEIRSRLQQQGFGWVDVAVSGQEVLLSGTPPRGGAGDEALALARAATCPTWAGPKVCAVSVIGAFGAALPPAPAAPAAPQATTPPAPATTPAATPAAPAIAAAALACEAAIAKLLQSSRIEFASGGAAIDARSDRLLDQIAQAARGCPGRILIEGHTDNVGDPAANQRLSEARAAAVRDALVRRGMPLVRLETLGYGEAKPLAANDTEAGRAANRRIDFKALP
jgi:outer membrane protein OmpA-like peptidoglycan-associated protein